jgi:DNA-binding PadR family transcriptional regulator
MTTLSLMVLHKLSQQPHTGYSLSKEIQQSTGQKPSFGSIYPILEKFTSEGIVSVHQEGRKKIYTLTAKGRRAAADLKNRHAQLIEQMISHSKMFCQVTGCDAEPMISMLERLKQGDDPLAGVSSNAFALRDLLFRLSQEDRIRKNQKEINAILKEAIVKLERIR